MHYIDKLTWELKIYLTGGVFQVSEMPQLSITSVGGRVTQSLIRTDPVDEDCSMHFDFGPCFSATPSEEIGTNGVQNDSNRDIFDDKLK